MVGETWSGLRILVTRPRHQAEAICREIAARGGSASLCPMLEIAPADELPIGDWWQGYDWLIFVSANAVRFAVEAGWQPSLAKLAAIGRATAVALKKNAMPVACQAPPPYTSESLLAQPVFQEVEGQKILIVRGIGGRPMLAQVLRERGAEVVMAELYRRLPPGPETVQTLRDCILNGLDAVLVTSAEALANLQLASGDWVERMRRLPLIVASYRLASIARQAGFSDVTTAASAMDSAMLEGLEKRLGKKSEGPHEISCVD